MFRSTKKKGRKQVLRTSLNDEESAEDESDKQGVVVRRKKRKPKGMVVRSFDVGEEADIPGNTISNKTTRRTTHKTKKKSKKRRGLGFGGAPFSVEDDDEDQEEPATDNPGETSHYGKEALEKLKSEQRMKPKEAYGNEQDNDDILTSTKKARKTSGAADFISLDNVKHANPDDDSRQIIEPIDGSLPTKLTDTMDEHGDPAEETSMWEDQIAKRAGLSSFPGPSSSNNHIPADKLPTLEKLKNRLQSTLGNLKTVQEDLDHAIMRRHAELQQTHADKKRHEQTLKETGGACDYYQTLRNRLVLWVGALRELKSKVGPIFDALTQLILASHSRASQEWIHWQNDSISLLQQANMVDQIVGKQPPLPPVDAMAVTVDEFGRDVESQFLRDRSKRCRARLERLQQSESDDVSCLWIDSLQQDAKDRFDILLQALRVAIDDLEAEYTSLQNLVQLFDEWQRQYPEEYRQCYANLSLGDLSAVLVQSEFCRSNWVIDLILQEHRTNGNSSSSDNKEHGDVLSLMQLLKGMETSESDEEGPILRVLERTYVAFLAKILNESPSASFVSDYRSRVLSSLVKDVVPRLDLKSTFVTAFEETFINSIRETLDSIAIPILKKGTDGNGAAAVGERVRGEDRKFLQQAIDFAKSDQALCLQHLLLNLLTDWMRHMQTLPSYEEIVKCLLDFISSKFLLLLSSMESTDASAIFAPIWKVLSTEYLHLLESPALIIEGAPIRAAAKAYGFS